MINTLDEILNKFKEDTEDLWDQFMEGDDPDPQRYDTFLDNAYKDAKSALLNLAQEMCREARIDELKKIPTEISRWDDNSVPIKAGTPTKSPWTEQAVFAVLETCQTIIEDRITQLQEQEKK